MPPPPKVPRPASRPAVRPSAPHVRAALAVAGFIQPKAIIAHPKPLAPHVQTAIQMVQGIRSLQPQGAQRGALQPKVGPGPGQAVIQRATWKELGNLWASGNKQEITDLRNQLVWRDDEGAQEMVKDIDVLLEWNKWQLPSTPTIPKAILTAFQSSAVQKHVATLDDAVEMCEANLTKGKKKHTVYVNEKEALEDFVHAINEMQKNVPAYLLVGARYRCNTVKPRHGIQVTKEKGRSEVTWARVSIECVKDDLQGCYEVLHFAPDGC